MELPVRCRIKLTNKKINQLQFIVVVLTEVYQSTSTMSKIQIFLHVGQLIFQPQNNDVFRTLYFEIE